MIDIHNHVLVGVDDGPANEEEAIALVKQAHEQGITTIVVTPHHLHTRYNNTFHSVQAGIDRLNSIKEISELKIQFLPGQEIRITDKIFEEIENQNIKGINDSKYLLIELPSNEVPHYTKKLLFQLQTKGFIPIIAHPERNKAIAKDINILYELVNNGALSQITASSLTGELGKNIQKTSIQMIEHHLVQLIASDAHHADRRPFGFDRLFNQSKLDDQYITQLLRNNELLIQDKDVIRERPIEFKKHKFFGLF
ncbi:tyrosine-protein phosphatase [Mammaliicoccus sciuri]|uniref:tyrosine-protein phosphatase n=1 Tax=Mammaliicoccus sciuri TaxID=1296 RepID=UPI002DB9E9DC|nr:CpsB/CapC family capsule biosynthesis tyrosine phosphatase [Mammaliicoccus sciuri]MEB7768267.1 capsular biosynthesis protein [Mammaliicoccus sciuri]MEB7819076.1 capsular biosynthesis protein [Mammaliicoccus sciuri]